MTDSVVQLYVQQYTQNVQHLLQQKGSRLRGAVMTQTHEGKQAVAVDQFGAVEAEQVTGRFQPIVPQDVPVDRRWVFPTDYDEKMLVDNFDKLRLLLDPTSQYVTTAVYGLGRQIDRVILNGMLGPNLTGEEATNSVTLPATQVVAATVGSAGAATGLNVAKLRAARKILMANEVDLDNDPIYIAITAEQHDNLLAETQTTDKDFTNTPVLEEGRIKRFMGFTFIHTELVPVDPSSGHRKNPFWARSGVHLGIWGDVKSDVAQRRDLRGLPWQVYACMTIGATRLEEKKVGYIANAE